MCLGLWLRWFMMVSYLWFRNYLKDQGTVLQVGIYHRGRQNQRGHPFIVPIAIILRTTDAKMLLRLLRTLSCVRLVTLLLISATKPTTQT